MVPGGHRPDALELQRIQQEKETVRQYQQVQIHTYKQTMVHSPHATDTVAFHTILYTRLHARQKSTKK